MSSHESIHYESRRDAWDHIGLFSRYEQMTGERLALLPAPELEEMQTLAMSQFDAILLREKTRGSSTEYRDLMLLCNTPESVFYHGLQKIDDQILLTAFWEGEPFMQAIVPVDVFNAKIGSKRSWFFNLDDFRTISNRYRFVDYAGNPAAVEVAQTRQSDTGSIEITELLYPGGISDELKYSAPYMRMYYASVNRTVVESRRHEDIIIAGARTDGTNPHYWSRILMYEDRVPSMVVMSKSIDSSDEEYVILEGTHGFRYVKETYEDGGRVFTREVSEDYESDPYRWFAWLRNAIGADGHITAVPGVRRDRFTILGTSVEYEKDGKKYYGRLETDTRHARRFVHVPLTDGMVLSGIMPDDKPIVQTSIHRRGTPPDLLFDKGIE